MWEDADKIKDEYTRMQEDLRKKAEDLNDQLYADLFRWIFSESDLGADEAEEIARIAIDIARLEVQK